MSSGRMRTTQVPFVPLVLHPRSGLEACGHPESPLSGCPGCSGAPWDKLETPESSREDEVNPAAICSQSEPFRTAAQALEPVSRQRRRCTQGFRRPGKGQPLGLDREPLQAELHFIHPPQAWKLLTLSPSRAAGLHGC